MDALYQLSYVGTEGNRIVAAPALVRSCRQGRAGRRSERGVESEGQGLRGKRRLNCVAGRLAVRQLSGLSGLTRRGPYRLADRAPICTSRRMTVVGTLLVARPD